MATGTIFLLPEAARLPDGSTNNAAPAMVNAKSSASAPTPHRTKLLFDAATREMCMWSFRMPVDYSSAPTLKVQFAMASATSGNVVIEARVAAITPGDATDFDAKAFDAANTSAATAVAGTAGHVKEISLSLTSVDGMVAEDLVTIFFARAADNASDTATGDMEFLEGALTYTTT